MTSNFRKVKEKSAPLQGMGFMASLKEAKEVEASKMTLILLQGLSFPTDLLDEHGGLYGSLSS